MKNLSGAPHSGRLLALPTDLILGCLTELSYQNHIKFYNIIDTCGWGHKNFFVHKCQNKLECSTFVSLTGKFDICVKSRVYPNVTPDGALLKTRPEKSSGTNTLAYCVAHLETKKKVAKLTPRRLLLLWIFWRLRHRQRRRRRFSSARSTSAETEMTRMTFLVTCYLPSLREVIPVSNTIKKS